MRNKSAALATIKIKETEKRQRAFKKMATKNEDIRRMRSINI